MGWIRKSLFALGLICLGGGLAGSIIVYSAADGFRGKTEQIDVEKKVSAQDIERIAIHSDYPNIKFVRSSDSDIHLRLTGPMSDRPGNNADIQLNAANGTLTAEVELQKRNKWIQFNLFELLNLMDGSLTKLQVEVALPDKNFKLVELDTDVGHIDAGSMVRAERLRLETSFGNISLDAFQGSKLELSSEVGRIEAKRLETSDFVQVETEFGSVDLSFDKLAESMELSTETGSLNVKVPRSLPLRLDLKNELGGISADLPDLQAHTKTNNTLEGSVGSGGPLLKARSEFGSIKVEAK
ncbi:DUF4097 family beta strand repeat-containing protein [Paenibacillus sp. GYB004]|uniref:DUF4097 family beta strand repeat-containing protein n=1 Tax=Paenibacillus sp. GYB004 TaxID=2994393 RepID=UPI002F96435B